MFCIQYNLMQQTQIAQRKGSIKGAMAKTNAKNYRPCKRGHLRAYPSAPPFHFYWLENALVLFYSAKSCICCTLCQVCSLCFLIESPNMWHTGNENIPGTNEVPIEVFALVFVLPTSRALKEAKRVLTGCLLLYINSTISTLQFL